MSHWYIDTPIHWIPSFHILVSSLHGCSVHSYIMFTHHCYIYSPVYMRWLFMYSGHMDHHSYYMIYCCMYIHASPLHDYFPLRILIFLLLNMWAVDMQCVELSATWIQVIGPPLESHIYCFLFPVILFYAINRAHVLLSCYMYHALYLFLIHCVLQI